MQRPLPLLLTERPWAGAWWVARTLIAAGHQAVFAGGAVRDALLGLSVADVDVATSASPEQVLPLFSKCLEVGRQFGVVVVVLPDGGQVEVASFRSDLAYVDGRRPTGIAPADERLDVQRRDFTINALIYDPVAQVVRDHVGGLDDLAARTIRVVGDPAARLAEDRLRVLRAFRFAARLDFTIEPASWQALQATPLTGLSRERIWQEMDKALVHRHRRRWWELVVAAGHHPGLCPLLASVSPTQNEATAAVLGHLPAPAGSDLAVAAILVPRRSADLTAWLESEPVSRERLRRLGFLIEECRPPGVFLDLPVARRRRLLMAEGADDLVTFCRACHPDDPAGPALLTALADESARPGHRPLVGARQVMAAGVKPGKRLGEILKWLEDKQLEGAFTTAEEGLDLLRTHGWL